MPYIKAYENEPGEIVIVYIDDVKIGEPNDPQYIVIDFDHALEVIKQINQVLGDF